MRVVGLLKSSQAPHGEAANIQSVLDILTGQGYPVSLKPGGAPSQKTVSLVGSWVLGSQDCTLVFYKDDGHNVEGSCDKGGVTHRLTGTYDDPTHISTTVTRTDPNGCVTQTRGHMEIITRDSIKNSQSGWNGCGVTTEPVTQLWSRS